MPEKPIAEDERNRNMDEPVAEGAKRHAPHLGRRIFRIIYTILTPFVCFVMVELLAMNNPFTSLELWQWALNLVWYTWFLILGYLIFGRLRRGVLFVLLWSFLWGLANHYVLSFRGRALFPSDLLTLRTAANVAGSYSYTPDRYVWGAVGILLLMLVLRRFLPKEKKRTPAGILPKATIAGALLLYFCIFMFSPLLDTCEIYAQQWKTKGNGFLLNFTTAMHYMRLSKPDGYDEVSVKKEIEALMPSDSAAQTTATNFIIIMDESFADYTQFSELTLSEDPTPFYHSLQENTIKGSVLSPVTGGGTPAVEFEALTGNSMTYLPLGTVAYQLYMSKHFPSLAWNADDLGALTTGYHPYLSSGWNRVSAYTQMGFQSQYYLDEIIGGDVFGTDYEDDELIRGYVSDLADFSRIYELTDAAAQEGKSSFIFNVTMQNHSAYDKNWTNLPRSAVVTGSYQHQGYDSSTSQYLALATATDNALKELIEHYENVEEPTCILFFGDHQPPLSNSFYEDIYGKSLDSRTPEEVMEQYRTPFFIWTNYDIEEQIAALRAEDADAAENARKKGQDTASVVTTYSDEADGILKADEANFTDRLHVQIGANFVGVLASRIAGYPQTGWMKYLYSVNGTFAAMTRAGYITQSGQYSESEKGLSKEEQALLAQYENLQYYNMFGDDEEDDTFFFYLCGQ